MKKPKKPTRPACFACAATTSTAADGKLYRIGAKFWCKEHKPEGRTQ